MEGALVADDGGLPGVVVVASHDRTFLDAVCTDMIDLDPAVSCPIRYGGNYTDYQAVKRAERERWQRRFAEEQEELADLIVGGRRAAPALPRGRGSVREGFS